MKKRGFSNFPLGNKINVIILSIAIGVVLIMGLLIRYNGEEKWVTQEIELGDECAIDDDCSGSFKTCRDGIDSSCENGCIYGKCTSCVPLCPGESKCGNETCLDSVRICPDGRSVRCANYCDEYSQDCTSCIPECEIKAKDGINYELKAGKFVLDAIPCIDANYTERKKIRIMRKNFTDVEMPEDYSMIMDPFSLDYEGAINLTLSVPEIYTNIKVMKCKGDDCSPVITEYVTELRCGGKISKEFLRERDYLEPRLMPIKISEIDADIIADQEIRSDKYRVRLSGNFNSLGITLAMPQKNVKEAKNPSLRIVGTPLVIKIKDNIEGEVSSTITMPYTSLEEFEEDSIGMYVKVSEGWKYLGGKVNEMEKVVTATISDIGKYLDDANEIETALMGVLCISCYGSSFTKVYEAENKGEIAVLLIHGFNPKPNTYSEFIDDVKLTNQPFDLWTFDYSSSKSVKKNANELRELLEKNNADYGDIYIVAHSLGGLIAQQALYDSYLENKGALKGKGEFKYGYLSKVRKVILAGVSNEGSPVAEVYRNLFENFINNEKEALFNPNSRAIDDLVKGIITPRVPGVDYNVIAGTKPYGFNLLFFKLTTEELADFYEKNDGVITVKSAQHIGDRYVNDQCEDYWEMNLTHTELIDDPIARKVIEKIISNDISEDAALLGNNKYFDISVENSDEDTYVIMGKKIRVEMLLDETGCSCGNGFCGEGEDEINCPSDCAKFLSENKKMGFATLIVIASLFFVYFLYSFYRREYHPHLKSMVQHVKTHYEIVPGKGYTVEQIRNGFLRNGWPKRVVNDMIKLLEKEFHDIYNKPLKEGKSYTDEDIRKIFSSSGWDDKSIEKALKGEKLVPGFELKEKFRPKLKGKRRFFGSG